MVVVRASSRPDGPAARAAAQVDAPPSGGDLLDRPLPEHPELVRGVMANGMRYVILPNKVPPHRFEAHMEMHVGSVDEEADEQGMAHIIEHVTFLGSRKRELLLGTGSRSNAYTDFHHTVFHVHAPMVNGITGQPMLPQVLEALREIAFEPQFLHNRIEKERRAVLAESRMMNTIEYRVDCQLLTYLHEENNLGCRFPIGVEEQVQKWEAETLKDFHKRWYFPGNATLYLVGDFGSGEAAQRLVESCFSPVLPAMEIVDGESRVKSKHAVRPPVHHIYGDIHKQLVAEDAQLAADRAQLEGLVAQRTPPTVLPSIFQHELLEAFTMNMFCKLPVIPVNQYRQLRESFIGRIIMSVIQFRINALYATDSNPPFTTVEMDFSDSGREGCCVTTLTVIAEPKNWKEALQLAVKEVRRVQQYGITDGEFKMYTTALLRDSEQLAEQAGSVPHLDNLEFIMESDSLGHTVMDQKQGYETLLEIVDTIGLDHVNDMARSVLSYISYYGDERELMAEALSERQSYNRSLGATLTTSIVICMPAYVDESGHSISEGLGGGGGGAMGQIDHDTLQALIESGDAERAAPPEADITIPEGAVRFDVTAEDIRDALAEDSGEIENVDDMDVPEGLFTDAQLDALVAERRPQFVPVTEGGDTLPAADPVTGVTQRKLSNGIRVNYAVTHNEPKAAMLRVVASGGRAMESLESGPSGLSCAVVGTRALSESGKVGDWSRQQVELFCVTRLINCVIEADEEFLCMDFCFAVGNGGIRATCELVNLIVESPHWEENAMERARQMYRSHHATMAKSLERNIGDKVMNAMLHGDRRWVGASPEEIDATTLAGAREMIMEQLVSGNLEVNLVGDFDVAEADEAVLKLLGTIRAQPFPEKLRSPAPVQFLPQPAALRNQRLYLRDSDERAAAYISGPAPARWLSIGGGDPADLAALVEKNGWKDYLNTQAALGEGFPSVLDRWAQRRAHPLYMSICLSLMAEVINSRLFTTVRDALGLTYDVSFEVHNFDRLDHGWWNVMVTSTPQKIDQAMSASLSTVRGLTTQPVSQHELDRAKRTLLTRHESDLKDNGYWISLLTHLQNDLVPGKDVDCLGELVKMYQQAIVPDIYAAYQLLGLGEEDVFTCVGISGPNMEEGAGIGQEGGTAQAAVKIAEAAQNGNLFQALQLAIQAQKDSAP